MACTHIHLLYIYIFVCGGRTIARVGEERRHIYIHFEGKRHPTATHIHHIHEGWRRRARRWSSQVSKHLGGCTRCVCVCVDVFMCAVNAHTGDLIDYIGHVDLDFESLNALVLCCGFFLRAYMSDAPCVRLYGYICIVPSRSRSAGY